ncbi:TPA: radical SAM protein [Salmonella enterica]|uniref:Radical SAM protein n=1 Tax=Salmonella enterica TaxID=28901 RepID=A0A759GUS1_SALER|nr:radical SAM protein [Salmonella enterica]HAG5356288.1 radical SAM protein [Salmonella enterica]
MNKYSDIERLNRSFISDNKLAIVSITNKCNLHCIYCRPHKEDEWYDKLSKSTNKSETFLSTTFNLLSNDDVIEVMLSGGEPFAEKNITQLALHLKNCGKFISIHTNGVHHKASDILDCLYKEKIKPNLHVSSELIAEHQISLRHSKMPYEFIEIATKKYGFKVELKVILHSLLSTYTDKFDKFIDKWLSHGVSQIRFQPIVQTGNISNQLILHKKDCVIIHKLMELKQIAKYNNIIRNSIESFEAILNVINSKNNKIEKKCFMHEKIIFIDSDGNILNCATMWGKNIKSCNNQFDFICCGFNS